MLSSPLWKDGRYSKESTDEDAPEGSAAHCTLAMLADFAYTLEASEHRLEGSEAHRAAALYSVSSTVPAWLAMLGEDPSEYGPELLEWT
jgi:hypothetical protein